MRVLVVTTEWPSFPGDMAGIYTVHQAEKLRECGVSVDVFHFRGRKSIVRYLKAAVSFLRKMRHDESYDVIHAHHGQAGVIALLQRRVPVVVTFHGSDLQGLVGRNGRRTWSGYLLSFLSRTVARYADKVIIVSQRLERLLPQRSFSVIPVGIDTDLFQPRPMEEAKRSLGMPAGKKQLLFVGDPGRPEKRYALAQKVLQFLKEVMDVEMFVAANIPHEQMPTVMNACDAMVITSVSEGSPTAVKEAMACNLPIISVDVGDIRERVADLDLCEIVSADARSMATSLQKVLATSLRTDARTRARALDERVLVKEVTALYESLRRDKPVRRRHQVDKPHSMLTETAEGDSHAG